MEFCSSIKRIYYQPLVKRWWDQYKLLPWPDTLALFISAAIPGNVSYKCSNVRHKMELHEGGGHYALNKIFGFKNSCENFNKNNF